jgi:phage I-like protein
MRKHLLILASSSDDLVALAASRPVAVPEADKPLPSEIVWMPKGEHDLNAYTSGGKAVQARVLCDQAGAQAIQASFAEIIAAGRRVYLDKDHLDGEATAWVTGFSWDPAQGIMARVEWTSLGEQLLRGKVYYSFSPVFFTNKKTNRVSKLLFGHAAGSLVNAPAFGAAMPALIAARLAGAESTNPASGGSPDNNQQKRTMKDLLIKILAALAVSVPADATEEQLVVLATANIDKLPAAGAEGEDLKDQLEELQALKAKDSERRKADAKTAVEAAVARGALPPKDEAIQAKWRGMIEADPKHAELLAAIPDNPALKRVTEPGSVIQAKDGAVEILRAYAAKKDYLERSAIYAKDISPLFKPGFNLGPILAVNSLGSLAGDLVTQRSLTLLKREFPALFAISTDFSDVAAKFGQQVIAHLVTIPTVTPYSADTGYADSGAAVTDVPVVINAHNAVQIAFGVNELAATNRDLFGEQAEGAHNAIGADLVDALLAVITAGNFSASTLTTVVALQAFARSSLTGIAKKLTNRKVPKSGRFVMLNTDYYEKIGQDTSIVSLATVQQANIITEGQLPRIAKFQPFEVQEFPTTGNLVGFAGAADALALSTRVPNDYTAAMPDVPSNGVVQLVKNPDTGITVMLVRFVDHQMGKSYWRIAYMRGAAKGQVASGERIISASPSS